MSQAKNSSRDEKRRPGLHGMRSMAREDAVDAVRRRPLAAGGVVAAIALFLAREPLKDLAGRLWNGKPDADTNENEQDTESVE